MDIKDEKLGYFISYMGTQKKNQIDMPMNIILSIRNYYSVENNIEGKDCRYFKDARWNNLEKVYLSIVTLTKAAT